MQLNYKLIGKRIRQYRKQLGLTQKEVAEKAGISEQYCSELELGKKGGTLAVYYQLAQALNVSLDSLVMDNVSNDNSIATSALINRIQNYTPEKYEMLLSYMDFLDFIN